jgi:hypothetical protein
MKIIMVVVLALLAFVKPVSAQSLGYTPFPIVAIEDLLTDVSVRESADGPAFFVKGVPVGNHKVRVPKGTLEVTEIVTQLYSGIAFAVTTISKQVPIAMPSGLVNTFVTVRIMMICDDYRECQEAYKVATRNDVVLAQPAFYGTTGQNKDIALNFMFLPGLNR